MSRCYICSSPLKATFQRSGCCFWACAGCGLECISPQPDDAVLARIYGDEHYYEALQLKESETAVKRLKQVVFSHSLDRIDNPPPGARLLDCGAGIGHLIELAEARGFEAYAVELSPVGAAACRSIIGANRVYEGDIQGARFPSSRENRFDVITMFDFIEHVRDPRAVLRWASSHLHPGGSLLVMTPRAGCLSHRLMRKWWFHYHTEHLWYFSIDSLTTLLGQVGFASAKVYPVYKSFSLDYFSGLAQVFKGRDSCMHPAIPSFFALLDVLLPSRVRSLPFSFPAGEMLVHTHV
jgi:SAM-dependent methyltransferase